MEITCECGYVARGPFDELAANAQAHARTVHRVELTAELLIALARRADAGDAPGDRMEGAR